MGKKIKREVKAEAPSKAAPETKKTTLSEDQVLDAMEVGVLYSSSELADILKLSGETRRDTVRHMMSKLAKDGKIRISEATDRKGKMYLYELAEK